MRSSVLSLCFSQVWYMLGPLCPNLSVLPVQTGQQHSYLWHLPWLWHFSVSDVWLPVWWQKKSVRRSTSFFQEFYFWQDLWSLPPQALHRLPCILDSVFCVVLAQDLLITQLWVPCLYGSRTNRVWSQVFFWWDLVWAALSLVKCLQLLHRLMEQTSGRKLSVFSVLSS